MDFNFSEDVLSLAYLAFAKHQLHCCHKFTLVFLSVAIIAMQVLFSISISGLLLTDDLNTSFRSLIQTPSETSLSVRTGSLVCFALIITSIFSKCYERFIIWMGTSNLLMVLLVLADVIAKVVIMQAGLYICFKQTDLMKIFVRYAALLVIYAMETQVGSYYSMFIIDTASKEDFLTMHIQV